MLFECPLSITYSGDAAGVCYGACRDPVEMEAHADHQVHCTLFCLFAKYGQVPRDDGLIARKFVRVEEHHSQTDWRCRKDDKPV